ncbi:MAG: alginate export family protein [Nitrospirota bacterium]|nr:alginate export family protein [Nitrospirota bacterium]
MRKISGHETVGVRVVPAIGIAMLLLTGAALADEGVPQNPVAMPDRAVEQSLTQGVVERIRDSQDRNTWTEQPDHVLYRLSEQKWNRLLRDAMNLPKWVEFSAQQRTRFESISHPWRRGQLGETDVQIPLRTHVRLGVTQGPFSLLFEGVDARTNAQSLPNDFNGRFVVNRTDILQLFASGTFHDTLGTGLRTDVHVGRITFEFGSTRLIGRRVFLNVTNAFDGVHVNVGKENRWRVRAFFTEPIQIDPTQLDKQNSKQTFWGTMGEFRQLPWMIVGPYYLGLNDSVSPTRRVVNTYGLRIHKNPASPDLFNQVDDDDNGIFAGDLGLDYELEGIVQTGTRGNQDFFAYMGHAQAGYTFNAPWYPRFVTEYDYASGTRTPGGSQSQTFDSLFGIRRFDMMPTGNFGPFFRSNISSPGWRVVVKPTPGLQVILKQRFWYLAQAQDAFAGSNQPGFGALQDITGGSGNYLGHDLELACLWRIDTNLILEAGYDHWFKGSYFDRLPTSAGLPSGGSKDADFFYGSIQVRL